MSKRLFIILLVGLLLIVAVAACGAKATPEPESAPVSEAQLNPITVGLVTAIGGVEEKFYSALAWKGVQEAKNLFTIEASYKESNSEADYAKLLGDFASANTDLTIAAGPEMAQAVAEAAKAHPDASFAIVDAESSAPNVSGLTFDIISPSYLAGYLAGGMSQTGVVCVYGVGDSEDVTGAMTGFVNGADYYRRQNGVNMEILGWDVYEKTGMLLNDNANEDAGYHIAGDFFDRDCDVLFAVAKDAGKGSAKAAQDEGKMFIGATVDWQVAFPEYGNAILTSVMKNTDKAVFDTTVAYAAGSFEGGKNYVGTLENNGVGLAPYHQFEDKVSPQIREDLNRVKLNILTGHLKPESPWTFGENNQPEAEHE
jgi:basic membrane protein A